MEIDLKFDDRFLEALWSGDKTSTIRRSCKGDPGDTFSVEYGDLIMEFRIMLVSTIHTLTDHAAHFLYQKEGFYSSQDLKDYCKNRGYTENLWIHEFRLIRQRRISDGTVTTSAPALSNEEDESPLKECPVYKAATEVARALGIVPEYARLCKEDALTELKEEVAGLDKFTPILDHCGASYGLSYIAALNRIQDITEFIMKDGSCRRMKRREE